MTHEERWLECYNLAKEYYEKNKDLLIPQNYIVKYNNKEIKLGEWIATQREKYKNNKLSLKRTKLLNDIKMVWKIKNNDEAVYNTWTRNYNIAKKYYEEHKNLHVSQNYIVVDKDGNEFNLGRWIESQRYRYKKDTLNSKQKKLLNKIEMIWNIHKNEELISDEWMKNYELAKSYYDEHNNLLIPATYVVKDENGKKVKLGYWINTQRRVYNKKRYGSLNKKQMCLLDEIDMVYNVRYYKTLVKQLDMEYNLYQYGLLDNKNIEELVDNKHLIYKDSNEIIKGNAIVLSKKLAA